MAGHDQMKRVAELTGEYMKLLCDLLGSPVLSVVARWKEAPGAGRLMLPDMKMRLAQYEKGRDVITYGAPGALFVRGPRVTPTPQTDCDCVMYPMMLTAHALGLGTCWNGDLSKAASGFGIDTFTDLRKMLGLPDHHDVYAAAAVGFPAVKPHSVPQRQTSVLSGWREGSAGGGLRSPSRPCHVALLAVTRRADADRSTLRPPAGRW